MTSKRTINSQNIVLARQ